MILPSNACLASAYSYENKSAKHCLAALVAFTLCAAPLLARAHDSASSSPAAAAASATLAFAISVGASPADAGRVVCAPNPVPHGGAATCRALSSAHALTAWGGDCAGQSGPLCSLANVTEAKTATAQFDASRITPRALNDTGVLASGAAGSGNASACDPAHPSGQDCHYGRDAGAALGQLAKQGASASAANGFDYTKIANDGSELPAAAALGSGSGDWACTRDNVTGLVWEVKTANPTNPGADLRDADYLYTWYDPHSPDGDSGAQNPGDDCQTPGRCTTSQFVQDVNAAGLCGARDWRLPSVQELESLLDLGRASAVQPPGSAPAIDPDYFPNTPLLPLWSSTPLADPSLLGAPSAWFVDFDPSGCSAGACPGERFLPLGVRLVRGGQ